MAYSGVAIARSARENLSGALAALQEDPNIPPDVLAVAQNIAQAVGALFEAERASSEPDGKSSVKSALGFVSQTLALLQEVKGQHSGVQRATEAIASTLSMLFPLSTQPSRIPPAPPGSVAQPVDAGPTVRDQPIPLTQSKEGPGHTAPLAQPPVPRDVSVAPRSASVPPPSAHARASRPPRPAPEGPIKKEIEVNIGATTESNFYVGFSGEISEGGVFAATYDIMPKGDRVKVLVTLPGGFEKYVLGTVRFVRDPMDFAAEAEPGMGIQFDSLDNETRELILRFIRKRPPMFYDE